jgi:IS30 family transposase
MKYNILRKYSWQGISKQITKLVKECEICQRASRKVAKKELVALECSTLFEMWEVDLVGPLPISENGNVYILTMIDHCIKSGEAVALRSKEMEPIRRILETVVIGKYGVPKMILSDNGKEFKNIVMEEMCKRYGIEWKFGSPYSPTTTGLVERFNQTLINNLKKLSRFGHKD